jgi:uncharacterized membrane protein YphA (DoxX/SURF4 family)
MNEFAELLDLLKEFAPQVMHAQGLSIVALLVMFSVRFFRTQLGMRFLPELLQWPKLPKWAKLALPAVMAGLPVLGAGLLAGTAPLVLAGSVLVTALGAIFSHHVTKAVGQGMDQNLIGEPSLSRKALAPLFPIDVTKLPKFTVVDGGKQ